MCVYVQSKRGHQAVKIQEDAVVASDEVLLVEESSVVADLVSFVFLPDYSEGLQKSKNGIRRMVRMAVTTATMLQVTWTRRYNPDVEIWSGRKTHDIDYFVIQF